MVQALVIVAAAAAVARLEATVTVSRGGTVGTSVPATG